MIAQFRSVSLLVAQDQLEEVSQKLREAEQPVVISDANGRILRTNDSFEQLLQGSHTPICIVWTISPGSFSDAVEVRRNIESLVNDRRTWRGEASLLKGRGSAAGTPFCQSRSLFSPRPKGCWGLCCCLRI